MSDSRQRKILEAALEIFLRYGFRRTTMGDLAEEVGVSRPALYLDYRNKEEIFRAVICQVMGNAEERAMKGLERAEGMAARFNAVFLAWVVEPYRMCQGSPHAQELYEAGHAFAEDLRKKILLDYEVTLKRVLKAGGRDESARGIDVGELARLLAASTIDLKRSVGSPAELKRQLDTAVRIHIELLGEA